MRSSSASTTSNRASSPAATAIGGWGMPRPAGVNVEEVHLALRPPLGDADHQPATVGREIDAGPVGPVAAVAEDFLIVYRIVAEVMEEDAPVIGLFARRHVPRFWIARVVKAAAVGQPGQRAGTRARNLIAEVPPTVDVAHAQQRFLAAVIGGPVGDATTVVGREPPVERARAVGALLVHVDERAIGAVKAVAQVEDRLVLRPVAARVKVTAFISRLAWLACLGCTMRPRHRRAERADGVETSEALFQGRAPGKMIERLAGRAVLRLGPARDGGCVAVFQPAVGIGRCAAHDRRQ